MTHVLRKVSVAAICIPLLMGCSVIDRVDDRTSTMNKSISEAENAAILLNIVRASLYEPLSFSYLANYTGHQTVTTLATFPNLSFSGAGLPLSSVQTSGLSITGSLNNDFSYVSNDDNATYAALLQPISPATIGYFLRQEYPRALLFFLMISQIRVFHNGTATTLSNEGVSLDELEAYHGRGKPSPFELFGTELQRLIDGGITAQIDLVTGSRAKFCFDRSIPRVYEGVADVHPSVYSPDCMNAKPLPVPAAQRADDKAGKKGAENEETTKGKKKEDVPFVPYYEFLDAKTGDKIDVYLRSAFGIYRYAGQLLRKKTTLMGIVGAEAGPDPYFVSITDDTADCFIAQEYRGRKYCVPNAAFTTKRIFSLLHDIVKLYTFPTAAPTTITARLIPGG